MAELKVLRPWGKSLGGYHWVHIDKDGQPLCGGALDEFVVEFRPEVWDGSTSVCGHCRQVEYHYSATVLQAGQVRRYGPSEYIYDVTDLDDEKRPRADVLAFCQAHIKKSYIRDDMPNWASPRLVKLEEHRPGTWRYHVFEESTH